MEYTWATLNMYSVHLYTVQYIYSKVTALQQGVHEIRLGNPNHAQCTLTLFQN